MHQQRHSASQGSTSAILQRIALVNLPQYWSVFGRALAMCAQEQLA